MLCSCPPVILDLFLKSLIMRWKNKWPYFLTSLSLTPHYGLGIKTNQILLVNILGWGFHPTQLMWWVLFCQAYILEDKKELNIQIAWEKDGGGKVILFLLIDHHCSCSIMLRGRSLIGWANREWGMNSSSHWILPSSKWCIIAGH